MRLEHGLNLYIEKPLGITIHQARALAYMSVREVTHLFLKELLTAVGRQCRTRISDLTIPSPVGFYEPYRAELASLARQLGIRRFRSLDEPVAAALGYGVSVAREETLLVVDFGGGTLDLAAVQLGPQAGQAGTAPVVAKHMLALGGNDVDRWLMEHFVPAELIDLPEWQQELRWEAMWVKERVSQEGRGEFRGGAAGACRATPSLGGEPAGTRRAARAPREGIRPVRVNPMKGSQAVGPPGRVGMRPC